MRLTALFSPSLNAIYNPAIHGDTPPADLVEISEEMPEAQGRTYLYSPSLGTSFLPEHHGTDIPEDVVEISEQEHQELRAAKSAGKRIVLDDEGRLAAADPPLEELKASMNREINRARTAAEFASFEFAGARIECGLLSRSRINGLAGYVALNGALPPDFPGEWKAIDNTMVAVPDVDTFKALVSAMVSVSSASYERSETLKAELAAAADAEQVQALTWEATADARGKR